MDVKEYAENKGHDANEWLVMPKPKRCTTCGKELGNSIFLSLNVYTKDIESLQESFGPYEVKSYAWCAECTLKAMGVKP